ncbi:MAG TPA: hypothetical protein VHL98_19285 [Microvirga sp.]|nr:hypothetical protein [Microvirga sp.]
MVWAVIVSLALAVLSFLVNDVGLWTVLSALTELGIVLALFALVCATEAFN